MTSELATPTPARADRRPFVRRVLPTGHSLPDAAWRRRHNAMVFLLFLHAAGLAAFGVTRGFGVGHSLLEAGSLVALGLVAAFPGGGRKLRAGCVAVGLLTASALTVHFSGGVIEAHFHFFVMIAVLTLYEDWLPFLLAAAYVVLHHGLTGVLDPGAVYNHADAEANPWKWAGIHAGFVAAAGLANVLAWRLNEEVREERERAYGRARESDQRFRHAFEEAPIGMALVAVDRECAGRFLRVNRALCAMTGYSEQDLLAKGFQDITHPVDLDRDVGGMERFVKGEVDRYDTEKRYVHANGHDIWVQIRSTLVRDDAGRPRYCITQVNDVTGRRAAEAELAHRALHDWLTGLPNRALFLDRLRHAAARRDGSALAVLFLDVDDFKAINDTLGHDAGDAVLRAYADRLLRAVREGDTVARFGGDEFTILCEGVGEANEVEVIADRVTEALSAPVDVGDQSVVLTVSVGVAHAPSEIDDLEALIADADAAMYRAKAAGRGRRVAFDERMRTEAAKRLELEGALRHAVERKELRLHYQPIVDMATGRYRAMEALLRWERPGHGLVSPAEFIPVAERTGQIVPIGEWVLRSACHEARRWKNAMPPGEPVGVSVNLSPRQLGDPGLAVKIRDALDAAALDPTLLCLEITETALMEEEVEAGLATLSSLQALGVKIAIDDFGAGFSSLGRLRRLPRLDILKIDRCFVEGSDREESVRAMLGAAIAMGNALGLTVVGEGVETEAEAEMLRRLGCHTAQGFHYARPAPASEIPALQGTGTLAQA